MSHKASSIIFQWKLKMKKHITHYCPLFQENKNLIFRFCVILLIDFSGVIICMFINETAIITFMLLPNSRFHVI